MAPSDYRHRIYQHYVSTHAHVAQGRSLTDLEPRRPYLNKLIRDHFPEDRDATIIDLGCGHGAIIHFARLAGYRNIGGIDSSPEQVALAKRLGIRGVREADLMETLQSLPDSSHDAVVCFDVIEHFTKAELLQFADNAFRVLRQGGILILHTPNGEALFGARMRYWDFTHELAFTRHSVGQLLSAARFAEIHCFEDKPVPHGIMSAIRWLLWNCIRAALQFHLAVETGSTDRHTILSQNLLAIAVK